MKNINKQRRQQFLYPELHEEAKNYLQKVRKAIPSYLASVTTLDLGVVAEYANDFWCALDALMLEYTAGAPLEEVKAMYPAVVEAFEKWWKADRAWYVARHPEAENDKLVCAFDELEDIGEYLQLLQLVSLGVLFNDGASLRRIAGRLEAQRGEDIIVEELLFDYIDNPIETQNMLHLDLYDDLVGAIWEEDPKDSAACMQTFLKSWYKAYRGQPWHDAHLRVGDIPEKPHWANYYGYWAFEAGALSYLYELDDTPWRDHMLYPKDLVDWARSRGRPVKPQPVEAKPEVLTAYPGDPCPESGEWYSVNWNDRRMVLKQGEPMPGPKYSAVGVVVWHMKKDVS